MAKRSTDVLSPAQRSFNMSRIGGRDTAPEILLRRALHARGWRYRVNVRSLPGRPDLVFAKAGAVVFVHGCFWHRHTCPMFKWPATRSVFWMAKINANAKRDAAALDALNQLGWRTLIVWECALKGPARLDADHVLKRVERFLRGRGALLEISGAWKAGARRRKA